MKIQNSAIAMIANSSQTKTHTVNEQLNVWVDKKGEDGTNTPLDTRKEILAFIDAVEISTKSSQSVSVASTQGSESEENMFNLSPEDENKISLLTKLIEALTGKKLKFYLPKSFHQKPASVQPTYSMPRAQEIQAQPQRQGWGINYQKHETYSETASMNFAATGVINTSDGRTINIDLSLSMSRSFSSENHVSIKSGDALIDPLVINFNGGAAELTNQKYAFDINNDGSNENISFVKSGSGFLVYDKNNDGKINNGSELFGPNTGDGFLELSAFDSDGNQWIDENDPIYEHLQIWTKNEAGEDQLFAIGQKGIGAIYLNALQSNFELKDNTNAMQGAIQKTGIYLNENGTAGTIQHVDLSV